MCRDLMLSLLSLFNTNVYQVTLYVPCSCMYLHPLFSCVHYKYARQSMENSYKKTMSPWTFLGNSQ